MRLRGYLISRPFEANPCMMQMVDQPSTRRVRLRKGSQPDHTQSKMASAVGIHMIRSLVLHLSCLISRAFGDLQRWDVSRSILELSA